MINRQEKKPFSPFTNAFFVVLTLWLVGLLALTSAHAADNLKAFPPAEEGLIRYVINLPARADEMDLKIELVVGKTVKTDAQNRYFFAGTIETESIPGWGFNFYILRKLGPMAGTLMAVDPDAPQVEPFISLGSEAQLLRYNNRLPLVVYVPAEVEVRYRIWRAEDGPLVVQKENENGK